MGRHSCCYKQKLRTGLWSPEEDEKLLKHITKYGHGCWSSVPKQAGLQRCGKSCRLRWINYLRPGLKRGTFSQQEENLIIELHEALGNRWSQIAAQLPGRTDNEIKNLWNSCIKKKLRQRGIDPNTHKPLAETEGGEDKAVATTSSNKTSGSNELKHFTPNSDTTQNPTLSTSKNSVASTKEFFLDSFVVNQESSLRSQACNSMGFFPHPQFNSGPEATVTPNHLLWLNQNNRIFDMNPEFNCNTMSTVIPSVSSSILSTPMGLKPEINMPPDNPPPPPEYTNFNSIQYWEVGNASNSSRSFIDGGLFSWADLIQDKAAQLHLDGEPEDFKWSEYLHGAYPISTALQNHSQPMYGDIKSESQFTIEGFSSWHQNQQPQQQQPSPQLTGSELCNGKDFQRISAVFGQI